MAIAAASVPFTATDTGVATWSSPLASNPPRVLGGSVNVLDPNGGVSFSVSSVTNNGCTILASAPFTGTIDVVVSD